MATKKEQKIKEKRTARTRGKIFGTQARPRLSVFRSAEHIYVQAIADDIGRTLAEASTLSCELMEKGGKLRKTTREGGRKTGIIELQAAGIEEAVFDRGPYLYHGRVKALADGAREKGLKF